MTAPTSGSNLTLRHLTGGLVAAVVWLIPATQTTVTTKLTAAQYATWLATGPIGDPPGKPDPTAVHLISGYNPALDTVDGFPSLGDCWEGEMDDPITGKVVTGLYVANGNDPAGDWIYKANHPVVSQYVEASCPQRLKFTTYNTQAPASTPVVLTQPAPSVTLAPLIPSGVPGSISSTPVHQAFGSWSSGSTFTVTVTAPAAGNWCGAAISVGGGTVTVSSVTQTNVPWRGTADITKNVSRDVEIWAGPNVGASASTSVLVTLSGSSPANANAIIIEFAGVATSSDLDTTGSNNGSSSTPTVTDTPTASENALIFAAKKGNVYQGAPGGGFTALTDGGTSASVQAAYQVVASTSGSYTCTYGSAETYVFAIASYKAAGAAATLFRRTLQGSGTRVGSRPVTS